MELPRNCIQQVSTARTKERGPGERSGALRLEMKNTWKWSRRPNSLARYGDSASDSVFFHLAIGWGGVGELADLNAACDKVGKGGVERRSRDDQQISCLMLGCEA